MRKKSALECDAQRCVMWVNLNATKKGFAAHFAFIVSAFRGHSARISSYTCAHKSLLSCVLFAPFNEKEKKTSNNKKTERSDRGKAIENRYAFSTCDEKKKDELKGKREKILLLVFGVPLGAFEKFALLLWYFCLSRWGSDRTLKSFVRRDGRQAARRKKYKAIREWAKWKWMSFMFPSCVRFRLFRHIRWDFCFRLTSRMSLRRRFISLWRSVERKVSN